MKIYLDRRLGDVHDLVSYSETLVCAQEHYPDAVDYRPDARLPVDFRKLDEFEVTKYTASLEELSIEDELDFVAIFPCDLNSERALDFSPFMSLSQVAALDPSVDDGGRPSITVDRISGLRLGLHLDSWDALDVSSRWKSRNRIVVNRGPADRYVYLVPVPIEEMAKSMESPEGRHPGEVADAYIRNARRIPCLRMLQSANVAYVCCTERLVHDACVDEGGHRADSRHYLGHFVRN
ncbi:MAG: hypothetical protein OXQ86_05960 [Gammaproteobacteria bacterium]|nr:hypothetical protein [Gammaproteobacteria bacterium]MDE0414599.1 hypothetical protein [Gammaproteobacteria bacterium]